MPPNNPSSTSSYDKSPRDELKVGTFNANSTTGTASGWGAPPPAVAGSWGEASGSAQPSRMSAGASSWQPQQQQQQTQQPPPPPPQSSFRGGRGGYEPRGGGGADRGGGWGQGGGRSADSGEIIELQSKVLSTFTVRLPFHRHGTLPSTAQFHGPWPGRWVQFERRSGRRDAGLRGPRRQGRLLRRSHRRKDRR